MDAPPASMSSDRLPDWLAEALDVLSARRRVVVPTAVGLVLLGAIVSLVAPSILPPRAIVGAAVAIAAALLATALALAMDASDLVVRGTRHVHAAGGTVGVRVGRDHDDVGPLMAALARHASTGPVRVALAPASRTAGVPGTRASALAEALARTGRKVLLGDLARGETPAAGLSDVVAGSRTLSEVVRFEQDIYLARLAIGSDPEAAIAGFPDWVEGLPSDLEALVVALPPLAEPGVLAAAAALDLTLVIVEVDRTERVDLIASLDAVDASRITSELVLVDPSRQAPDAAAAEEPAADGGPVAEDEPVATEEPGTDGEAEVPDGEARASAEGAVPTPGPEEEPGDEPAAEAAPGGTGAGPADEIDTSREAGVLLGGAGAVAAGMAVAAADEEAKAAGQDGGGEPPASSDDDRVDQDGPPEPPFEDEPPSATWEPDATAELAIPPVDAGLGAAGTAASEPEPEPHEEPTPPPEPDEPGPSQPVEPAPEPEPEPIDPGTVPTEPGSPPRPADAEPGSIAEPGSEPEAGPEPEPVEPEMDDASLEVARTSAALHQLAQQVWQREPS